MKDSPNIDTNAPVAREQERGLHDYYGWPAYWMGAGYLDVGGTPPAPGAAVLGSGTGVPITGAWPRGMGVAGLRAPEGDPNLRSGRAVNGYHIEATDGSIGHVEDYLFSDEAWTLDHIIIDTKNWLPGRKVIIGTEWIRQVAWSESRVYVGLTRERIQQAPEFDGEVPVSEDYADSLRRYYGRPAV